MTWDTFIKYLQSSGYEGETDLEAVKQYLGDSDLDTETVEIKGEDYSIESMWEDRARKRLDLSVAEMADEIEQLREDRETMKEELDLLGKSADAEDEKHLPPFVDTKVGADRLAYDPKGGYNHAGEFYSDVVKASGENGMPDRLADWTKALSTYSNETVGADGGFAVPGEYRTEIIQHVTGEDSVLARTDQYPISGNSIVFPDDDTTAWQTSGGVLAYWVGEASAITQSKVALKQKNLRLRKVACLVPVTDELLQDAGALQAYVTRKAGEKLQFKVDEAIFRGTGANQPLGFLNSSALVTVAKESGQAADTVVDNNIVNMYSRMYGPWRDNAVWFINQDIEPQLFTMSVGNWPIYLPAGSLSGSPFGTLLGRPVVATQHCETLGDVGDICFASMGQYVTAVKSSGVEASSSIHLWFDQDATAFKFRMRVDGQPWMGSTITPRDGSNTMSAFVTLAARA
jgi:HK97 family phage major capsid protein